MATANSLGTKEHSWNLELVVSFFFFSIELELVKVTR